MQTSITNTVRKYHRSSALAFPQHTDYACALEVPEKKTSSKTFIAVVITAVVSYIAFIACRVAQQP